MERKPLTFVTILPNTRKKNAYQIIQKSRNIKRARFLLQFCDKFERICSANFQA